MKYWIGVISHDQVKIGVREGIAQLNHGRYEPLARMQKGDWLIYYSGKEILGEEIPCQKFTAIGQIADDEIFTGKSLETEPFKRRVTYLHSINMPITDLLDQLSFIPDKKHWGYPFRFGLVAIPRNDFLMIAKVMLDAEIFETAFSSLQETTS